MIKEISKTTILTGVSKKRYTFNLWGFDDFDDVKGTFQGGGLYLFTKRVQVDGEYRHIYLYLGETVDYYTRYDNHHKEKQIRDLNSNCIGFCSMSFASEEEMKKAEKDILDNYDFPCNLKNN